VKRHKCHIVRVSFFDLHKYQCGCGKYWERADWIKQWDKLAERLYRAYHELGETCPTQWWATHGKIKDELRDYAQSLNRYMESEDWLETGGNQ